MSAVFSLTTRFETTGACPTCGVETVLPANMARVRRQDGGSFYCANGHSQSFTETAVAKLEKQLAFEKRQRELADQNAAAARESRDTARRAEAIVRGKLKAHKERVGNGVCPCCNRTFQNLMRHMSTKHPTFKTEAST